MVLLGEPGIGKTFAIKSAKESVLENETDLVDIVDLRGYGEESRLVKRLFESDKFLQWKNGNKRLHLFLDSLDECLLRIDTIAVLLRDELSEYPVDRLSIRIACRTAVWPQLLEDGLKGLWAEEQLGIYELCPLRRCDVAEAARINGIDPDAFIERVDRVEAVPLAIKPVTLQMLINIYALEGQLPSSKWELYEKGCQLLTEELNESRQAANRTGDLRSEQRLVVSSRIAAVTMLANRFAIWTNSDKGDVPEEDVALAEVYGGEERAAGDQFLIGREEIKETLDTGLYTSRGPGRLSWAHQTYAEFLAARYLSQDHFSLQQILTLIRHPSGKLVPQLHELSAWLATKRDDVFEVVLLSDPEVLMLSDVSNADEATRIKLTGSLLSTFDLLKLYDNSLKLVRHYHKLKHSQLAEQLRPSILDKNKGIPVRQVAFRIARECSEKSLSNDLLGIALDGTEDEHIRSLAIMALEKCGDDSVIRSLKPLIFRSGEEDPEDEIKGNVLKLVWPKHLTSEELFAVLTPPKRENSFGSYHEFIWTNVASTIDPADLVAALSWVNNFESVGPPRIFSLNHAMSTLADQIILAGLKTISDPSIQSIFARVLLQRLRSFYRWMSHEGEQRFYASIRGEVEKRHKVIQALVSELGNSNEAYLVSRLFVDEDLPWLIDQALQHEKSGSIQAKIFATMAGHVPFDVNNTNNIEIILDASQQSLLIKEQFALILNPIELASEQAKNLKRDYDLSQDRSQESSNSDSPLTEQILHCINKCETGIPEAWWELNYWMLSPAGQQAENEFEPDLTKLPGWSVADDTIRNRIIQAAERYLHEGNPDNEHWIGLNQLHRPALAGYRALRLLYTKNPSGIECLEELVWNVWAASIVGYPDSSDEFPTQRELIAYAYAQAPEAVLDAFNVLAKQAISKSEDVWVRNQIVKLDSCPSDDKIKSVLLDLLRDSTLAPEQMGRVFTNLLERQIPEAIEFAKSLLGPPAPTGEILRKKALVVGRKLLSSGGRVTFNMVWRTIESDDAFGQEIFLDLVKQDPYSLLSGHNVSQLSEQELGTLFLWLEQHFPRNTDPNHEGPRESIPHFRDGILQLLRSRGTMEAVHVLQGIKESLPGQEWLYRVVLDAQNEMLRKTWLPPKPSEILALACSSDKRLVTCPEQLLDVLIESLQRLQLEDLQGETGRAKFLWDQIPDGKFRPKDEPTLSDYIKGFLNNDLKLREIIVNREVEVHRGPVAGRGPSTDIHVDVITSEHRHIKAVIEVKGCWNPDLKTSMKGQLIDKYFQGSDCQHGIYLVVWFNKAHWDAEDSRKRKVPANSIEEIQRFFEDQENEFSTNECVVRSFVLDANWR